ncbi:MAG: hypothetical protein HY827_07105 [Actinobacteria bacterium]|nr:hypothetical protein [Actinomycetota bacterium]
MADTQRADVAADRPRRPVMLIGRAIRPHRRAARPPRCENVGAMVDLHLHLLPGIDDGPADVAATAALADALVADGISAAVATPHVNARYRNTSATIERAADSVAELLRDRGLELKTGAEVSLDRFADLGDDELVALSLGGAGRHLLVECPHAAWPLDFELHVARLALLKLTAVIAHPERCAGVQHDAAPLRRLVQRGALVQVVAGSLTGDAGSGARKTARALIASGDAHIIASDAHGVLRRSPKMSEARALLKDDELAQWLTETLPRAIFEGTELPPRPRIGAGAGRAVADGEGIVRSTLRRLGDRVSARGS